MKILGKIMIVEDKKIIYRPLAEYFKKKNWKVIIANDGNIALEILLNQKNEVFDCMLLDLRLKEMDGDILLIKLKERNIIPPKTILLSAYTDNLDVIELHNLGILKIIKKPCDPSIIENIAYNISCHV